MALYPLDGPSQQYTLSITDSSVTEVKHPTNGVLTERKVITLQSEDGKFRVYFGDGSSTPSVADVSSDGLLHYKIAKDSYEASDLQPLYIISESGNIDVHVVERA